MTLTQDNDLGPYDFGDPKSATYPLAAEQSASRARQLREEHDQTRRDL